MLLLMLRRQEHMLTNQLPMQLQLMRPCVASEGAAARPPTPQSRLPCRGREDVLDDGSRLVCSLLRWLLSGYHYDCYCS
jgi:hypothetical protein